MISVLNSSVLSVKHLFFLCCVERWFLDFLVFSLQSIVWPLNDLLRSAITKVFIILQFGELEFSN